MRGLLVEWVVNCSPNLHSDHLGRPKFATRADGSVSWDGGITTPFGIQITALAAQTQALMFPGQYMDSETTGAGVSLSHNWHRTYDPTLGRYLQADPIGLVGGLNRYAYVGGNPNSYVDPTGEFIPLVFVAGFAISAALDAYVQYKDTGCIKISKVIFSGVLGTIPISRLKYVTDARRIPKLAKNARDAYNRRKALKKRYRFGFGKFIEKVRPSKPFEEIGNPLLSSGKTNPFANLAIIGGGGSAAGLNILTNNENNCGC